MAESKLRTLSVDFAVQILNLVKALKNQHETIVSNQIGRAGTSIGANIHEAQYKKQYPPYSRLVLRSLGEGEREKTSSGFILLRRDKRAA